MEQATGVFGGVSTPVTRVIKHHSCTCNFLSQSAEQTHTRTCMNVRTDIHTCSHIHTHANHEQVLSHGHTGIRVCIRFDAISRETVTVYFELISFGLFKPKGRNQHGQQGRALLPSLKQQPSIKPGLHGLRCLNDRRFSAGLGSLF